MVNCNTKENLIGGHLFDFPVLFVSVYINYVENNISIFQYCDNKPTPFRNTQALRPLRSSYGQNGHSLPHQLSPSNQPHAKRFSNISDV